MLLTMLDGTCTFADVRVRKAEAPVRASMMPKTVVYKRNGVETPFPPGTRIRPFAVPTKLRKSLMLELRRNRWV